MTIPHAVEIDSNPKSLLSKQSQRVLPRSTLRACEVDYSQLSDEELLDRSQNSSRPDVTLFSGQSHTPPRRLRYRCCIPFLQNLHFNHATGTPESLVAILSADLLRCVRLKMPNAGHFYRKRRILASICLDSRNRPAISTPRLAKTAHESSET